MNSGKLLRAASLTMLAAALLATALAVRREPETPVTHILPRHHDDLSVDLARCRSLGLAGGDDPRCRATWAQSRNRFFGNGREEP